MTLVLIAAAVWGDKMKLNINTDYGAISPYSIMIALAYIVGLYVQCRLNLNRGISRKTSFKLIMISPGASIICALLLTYYSSGGRYIGLSSMGGLVGMYIGVLLSSVVNRNYGEIRVLAENCTFTLPLMYSISKIGCLFAGCCHGIEYSGFLSLHYISATGREMTVFPVQLIETIVFFMIFVVGMVLYKMHNRKSIYVVFGLSVSVKFILDFFRESHIGKELSLNQILCLILCAVMMSVSWFYKRRQYGRLCLKRD